MAKLRSGILGKSAGAIANVVTSSWKGINYARERVIPANPKSAGQTRVRGVLGVLVLIGRSVKSLFIDTYWEKLVKGTANSGWAKFIGVNQKAIQKLQDYENIKLATGDLESAFVIDVTKNGGANTLDWSWDDSTVSNGSGSDIVYLHAFVPERNFVYTQSVPLTRTTSAGVVSIPNIGAITGTIYAFMTLKKTDGSLFSTTDGQSVV